MVRSGKRKKKVKEITMALMQNLTDSQLVNKNPDIIQKSA